MSKNQKDLIHEVVEEQIREKKEKWKREAKKEILESLKEDNGSGGLRKIKENPEDTRNLTRRSFLKKTGLGTLTLGALSLTPATSSLKISKNGLFGNQDKKLLEDQNGRTKIQNLSVDKLGVNQELVVPDKEYTASDRQIWVNNGKIKAKINGDIYKLEKKLVLETEIDDFEDSDLSEYGTNEGGDWQIVSDVTAEGSNYSLSREGTSASQSGPEIASISGLNSYPSSGDVFEFNVYFHQSDVQSGFYFAVQNSPDTGNDSWPGAYRIKFDLQNSSFQFNLVSSDGSYSLLKSSNHSFNTGKWYKVRVDWSSDGSFVIELYDNSGGLINELTASDSTWSDGGIGMGAYGPIQAPSVSYDKIYKT